MSSRDLLSALFSACHRELVSRAAQVLGSRSRAEDVAQEAYAGFLNRRAATEITEPRAYLFASIRNLALDRLRRDKTEGHAEAQALADLLDPAADTEAALAARQRLAALAAALNELPAATRDAFLLARLDGLSHRAIAGRLNVSVSMVEKHVMRAIAHLRARLPEGE
ncbi:MAG: sigma-70 family RNA polymerase sigma factor [Paracraurococcus sp.]|jgi:RNA polymerase sigma factor (sigma-70 family)